MASKLVLTVTIVGILVMGTFFAASSLPSGKLLKTASATVDGMTIALPSQLKPQVRSWLRTATKSQGRRVILRYTACGGLVNQHYSHISAFMLALALRAEVVFPDACYRNSFGLHYDMDVKRNKMEWYLEKAETLWDTSAIQELWSKMGIKVHLTPNRTGDPLLTQPRVAYPLYNDTQYDPRLVARLPDTYIALQSVSLMVARARRAIERRLTPAPESLLRSTDYVVLDMPCAFFALRTANVLPLATEVARALPFSAAVDALARRAAVAMAAQGVFAFNGVHLRIEKDAGDWAIILGGQGRIWHLYCDTLASARFNASQPLYVASGLLTYGANKDWETAKRVLMSKRLASRIIIKDEFVPKFELKALNTEQMALLDLLILARAERFVGFGSSTFSYYLTQYRTIHGHSRESSVLVAAPRIGTDEMFSAAAVVTAAPILHLVD